MTEIPRIRLENISLSYGTISALENVHLEIAPSEIHALIGEHGAGKSSLAHIISGFLQYNGQISWEGTRLPQADSRLLRSLGVRFVTQENELFDHLSVAQNLVGKHTGDYAGFFINQKKILEEAQHYLNDVGCEIDPRKLVEELTLPEKVVLDILRQLYKKPRLLILDEAMEKLTAFDLELVLRLLRELRSSGGSTLFITHRIDDVYSYADRVSIMRKGRIIITESVENIDKINLIKLAYTQILKSKVPSGLDKDFYHLLKYNEAILEFLPIALLVADRDGCVKLLNQYGEKLLLRSRSRIIDRKLEHLFAEINDELRKEIENILKRRDWQNLYNREIVIGEKTLSCNIIIDPIMDGNYYLGSIVIIDDITEQENLREKINVSERLASVGFLAAGVSHEINNPLEIINNFIDVLKNRITEEDSLKYLGFIEEEVDSIEQIVSNLITFSEKNKYENEILDIFELTAQTINLIKPNARKGEIQITLEPLETRCNIYASKTRIKQVILNLVRNAFEAMPGGGKLHIDFEVHEDGFVLIQFLDNGIGFDSENLNNVLMPFYTTKHGREENMGLGLSIIFGILESYGGRIEAENRPDSQGSIIKVYLPITDMQNGSPPVPV